MEFAAAALSAVAGGISSAASSVGGALGLTGGTAAAAGTAASGGLGLLGKGSLLTGLLSGGATIASMMGSLQQGDAQAASYEGAANDALMESGIEATRGIERRDNLKRALLERLGQQDVAAAASGVDLSFGTPAMARDEAQRDAERALVTDQSTEDLRKSRLQERASQMRIAAASARSGGRIKAFTAGATGVTKLLERG
jgi:hypothetical protein